MLVSLKNYTLLMSTMCQFNQFAVFEVDFFVPQILVWKTIRNIHCHSIFLPYP